MSDIEKLDWAERWLFDGFDVATRAGGALALEVDMLGARALVEKTRGAHVKVTYNHVVIRAALLALERHPSLHVLVAGSKRLRGGRVDLGLSVSGQTPYAPVMVIEDATRFGLVELATEIARRVPGVRAKEERDLADMRKRGWLIPFRWLRRRLLAWLGDRLWFRRKLAGTFQVTCVREADIAVPLILGASLCLGVGGVRERVIAKDGHPVVRPTVILLVTFDHKAWDGSRAAVFLGELRKILEENQLAAEVAIAA